ncbi:MAG: YeeE/YedE family protein [Deferribacteraceae bacterium]|jgi:uncharacterized membrane protein YedE/YeeE|nr:YeeE/YedE family protein [Deferribacteraceae bacterium]
MNFIIPVSVGFLFGFSLQKAGLGHYDKVVNQFRFRDNLMMQFMFSAISVGGIVYFAFSDIGFAGAQTLYLHNTYILGNLLGGAVFGVGMAVAGTCPGTILAGIGQGNLDYLSAGVLGFLTGGLIYGINFPFFLSLTQTGFYGKITWEGISGINHWALILLIAALSAVVYKFASAKRRIKS